MPKVTRDYNSIEKHGLDRERVARRLLGVVSLTTLVGCNIVQGFQEAGDTLFPQQSTHLAAPGLRLASGHYHSLDVAVGAELFLLARTAHDPGDNLSVMRYAQPQPCSIPGV